MPYRDRSSPRSVDLEGGPDRAPVEGLGPPAIRPISDVHFDLIREIDEFIRVSVDGVGYNRVLVEPLSLLVGGQRSARLVGRFVDILPAPDGGLRLTW